MLGIIGASSVRIRLTDPTAGVVRQPTRRWARTIYALQFGGVGLRHAPAGQPAALLPTCRRLANARLQALISPAAVRWACSASWRGRPQLRQRCSVRPRSGIDSYSKISRDEPTLRKGSYSKRLSFTLNMSWSDVDSVTDFFSESDARVLLWNVSDAWRATKILGFLKSWDQLFSDYDTVDMSVGSRDVLSMPDLITTVSTRPGRLMTRRCSMPRPRTRPTKLNAFGGGLNAAGVTVNGYANTASTAATTATGQDRRGVRPRRGDCRRRDGCGDVAGQYGVTS